MFGRLLWKLLRGNRGRLTVALVAVISGAAVISALLNLELDVERKLTQEFRLLGANLVISPGSSTQPSGAASNSPATPTSPALMSAAAVLPQVEKLRTRDVVASAPYLYIVARAHDTPVVVAGTWLDETRQLEPTWKLQGDAIASRDDATQCLVGRDVARQFGLAPGGQIELDYLARSAQLRVAGIVDAGGAEDSQIFVNLPVAQKLAGLDGQIQVVQLSVSGTAASISGYAERIGEFPARLRCAPDPTSQRSGRQSAESHAAADRLDDLLILVLTALCVLATMAALAMERRADVGLMKALGGTISRIVGLFLAEVGVLGAVGGLIGCIGGRGARAVDGTASFRHVHHAAMGSLSAYDRVDDGRGHGGRFAAANDWEK